ncbi:MAG: LPS export ABC transporter permease LptG [Usitatibacteraceae bacterium]
MAAQFDFPGTASLYATSSAVTILFRYLTKEIFSATLLLLMALLALFALFDLIRELDGLGKGGRVITTVLIYVALKQPSHVVVIFPVAALMGTLFAVTRLSMQSELAVMRASGLSLTKLAGFATVIGLGFSALTFLFGEYVAPAAEDAAKRMRLAATSSVVAQEFRSGFWVKDGLSFINIQTVTLDTKLLNLRIYEFDRSYRLASISLAKSAAYDARTNNWVLSDVEKTTFEGARARMDRLATAKWNSAMTPDLLAVLRVSPDDMSLLNLNSYIEHLQDNKQNSTRYKLAFWAKVFQPLAVVVMMLAAIPFAIQSQRATGVGGMLLLGIMIGLGFYFLNQLASHLAVINDWPPFLTVTVPLLLFLGVAIALLTWREYPTRFRALTA